MRPTRSALLALLLAPLPALAQEPLVQVSGPSPFAGCRADAPETQEGTLYPDTEVEPRLAVNPRNPRHLVGAFQQDRWSNGAARGLVARVSLDGGASWRESVIPGLTLCSGGPFARASDPWISFAPNGDVYSIALATHGPRRAILVNKSTDGGRSWSAPVALVDDVSGVLHDKESLTADPTDRGGRLVYAVWDRFDDRSGRVTSPAVFTRTTDGGRTWEPARVIYDPGLDNQTVGHQVVVLPNRALLDFFTEFRSVPVPGAPPNQPVQQWETYFSFMLSNDKGVTWMGPNGQPFRPVRTFPRGVTSFDSGQPVRTAESLVDVAVDPRSGRLYAVWQDSRFGAQTTDAIAFSASADGGLSWSAPIRVSQTPETISVLSQQAFTPTVQIAADGTLAVTYYDFRHDDPFARGTFTDYWAVRCRPSVSADCTHPGDWGREARLTDDSFDMQEAPLARGLFVGDYEGLGAAADDFLALFAQPHAGDLASVFFRRIRP